MEINEINEFKDLFEVSNLEYYREGRTLQSVYIEFVRKNAYAILEFNEFEALRRWLLNCEHLRVEIDPANSHRLTRDFYKALRQEQKQFCKK